MKPSQKPPSRYSDEADMLSKNMSCRLIRTSVKEDVNVSSVFRYLATKCFQLMRQYNNILPLEVPVISESKRISSKS